MMKTVLVCACLLAAAVTGQAGEPPASSATHTYRGTATDLKSGRVLYAEEHTEFYENGRQSRLHTTFRDASGRAIAERTVDYSGGITLPTFRLEDLRTGYVEGGERVGGAIRLYWRRSASDSFSEKTLTIPSPAVADAGFHRFVQERWDGLMAGSTLEMYFGVPFLLDYFRFRMFKERETVVAGREAVVIRCEIDNMLLRLFVDPILLTYDRTSRRMLSYEGISNINNDEGKSPAVRIVYAPHQP